MRAQRATAEIFLTAFKTLPRREQDIFLSEVMKDKKLREDLLTLQSQKVERRQEQVVQGMS